MMDGTDIPSKSDLPSFMKATASFSSRKTPPASETVSNRGIDAADLFSRATKSPGPSFVTSFRSKNSATPRSASPMRNMPAPLSAGPFNIGSSRQPAYGEIIQNPDKLDDSWDRVKVFIRVRPAIFDTETPGAIMIEEEQKITVNRVDGLTTESNFIFDRIMAPGATQQEVYDRAVAPIVDDVMLGYNGSVMAYGQTGAGKTYTLANMEADHVGMIPRALADIFNKAAADVVHSYRVYMSYVQIYMEVIKDLLLPSAEQLAIREDANGVFLSNVHEEQVACTQDCLKILQRGEANRIFAATEMNAHSSRSHAIVIVTVFKQRKRAIKRMDNGNEVVGRATTMGRMFLVDLAGSERLKKSKSVGLRAQEAKAINRSLHMLGMCVNARSDPAAQHVPFRDSKLTRLLQESLGGNAKTSMIIAVSDVKEHVDETFQSCVFGSRAILVRTQPTINEFLDLSALNDEIAAQLREVQPETALERALLDREEQLERVERDLNREREARKTSIKELQKKLNAAMQEGQVAKKGGEDLKLALTATQLAHERELQVKLQQAQKLTSEVALLQEQLLATQDQLAAARLEVSSLQQSVAATKREVAEAQAAKAAACRRVDEAHAHTADIQRGFEERLEAARAEKAHSESRAIAARQAGEDALSTERERARGEVQVVAERHAREVERARAEVHSLAERLERAGEEAHGLGEQLQVERDAHSRTQQELATVREARDTLENANTVLLSELEAAHASAAAAASAAAEDAAVMRRGFEHRLATAAAEFDDLQERHKASEACNRVLERELEWLRKELEGARVRLDSALTHAGATRRQERAAAVIQRNWRLWQQRQLLAARAADAQGWQRDLRAMSVEQRVAAAQAGRALVVSCVQQIEATTHTLLMEMLLSGAVKRKVKAAQKAAGIGGFCMPKAAKPLVGSTAASSASTAFGLESSGAVTPLGSAHARGVGYVTPPRSATSLFTPR